MVQDITLHIAFLLIGFIFLVKGSDQFVNSASRIAKKLGVSDFFIGLTLVAVGTSLPEIASAVTSSLKGVSGLVVGNLLGANIADNGLIIGICAMFGAIKVTEIMIKRDGYIMMFVSLLIALFALNGIVTPVEGLFLLLLYFAYILFLLTTREKLEKKLHFKEFLKYFFSFQYLLTIRAQAVKAFEGKEVKPKTKKEKQITKTFKEGLTKDFILAAISLVVLIVGARTLIDQAVWFSDAFGVTKTFIGASILAIGTTLPELSVSINAIRKGFGELLMGNIIGSNITNIGLVFGMAAIINPVAISASTLTYLIPAMLLFAAALIIFLRFGWKINHPEGIALLAAYIGFIVLMYYKG